MSKTVAIFSGQGSQYISMGESLYDNSPKSKEIFDCGSDILGCDLKQICFNGPEEKLNQTLYSQPAIFSHSLGAYYAYLQNGEKPEAVAGHSLGEFAALQAAGAFSLEDGFRIIKARAKAMQDAANNSSGAMAAILRVPLEEIQQACNNVDGLVFPVNLNTSAQTVISGEIKAVDSVIDTLTSNNKRARAMKLSVSTAFHTIMMQPAADVFQKEVASINYSETIIPFFSNLTGTILEIDNYPNYFAQHMVSPVKFTQQCQSMAECGIDKSIEFGPKKIISGFISKNMENVVVNNIDTADDLNLYFLDLK